MRLVTSTLTKRRARFKKGEKEEVGASRQRKGKRKWLLKKGLQERRGAGKQEFAHQEKRGKSLKKTKLTLFMVWMFFKGSIKR